MSKKTHQLNVRISPEMEDELEQIAGYEHATVPELVRGWLRKEIDRYRNSKRFEAWRKRAGV